MILMFHLKKSLIWERVRSSARLCISFFKVLLYKYWRSHFRTVWFKKYWQESHYFLESASIPINVPGVPNILAIWYFCRYHILAFCENKTGDNLRFTPGGNVGYSVMSKLLPLSFHDLSHHLPTTTCWPPHKWPLASSNFTDHCLSATCWPPSPE